MEVREDDESFKNAVDLLFDALEQKDPDHFALRQYKKYKLAAGKTAKSILISCGARLAPFDIKMLLETGRKGKLIRHHSVSNLSNRASTLSKTGCSPDAIFAFTSPISSLSSLKYFLG